MSKQEWEVYYLFLFMFFHFNLYSYSFWLIKIDKNNGPIKSHLWWDSIIQLSIADEEWTFHIADGRLIIEEKEL